MVRYTQDDVAKAGDGGLPAPGKYLAEVQKSEEKQSASGDPMFNIQFKDVETGSLLCFDTIMLGGRGIGIGHKKLLLLGAVLPNDPVHEVFAEDLIGKRVWLDIVHEPYVSKKDGAKKMAAKPNFNAERTDNSAFGYTREGDGVDPFDKIGEGAKPGDPF